MKTFPWNYHAADHSCQIYAADLLTHMTDAPGTPLHIEAITDTVLRIHCRTQASFAIEKPLSLKGTWTQPPAVADDGTLQFATSALQISIDPALHIQIANAAGQLLCADYTGSLPDAASFSAEEIEQMRQEGHVVHTGDDACRFQITKTLFGDECFYGLGDKTGYLNKKGYDYLMWNTDNPDPQVETPAFQAMYKSIPFFITLRENCVYGIFFDNHYKTGFDMGYSSTEYYSFRAADGALDYYFLSGVTIADLLRSYTDLTGRCPLPQLWTLGYHQSRWGYSSEQEVRQLAQDFETHDIPCDAIHMDIDYMDHYKVFTTDQERFPSLSRLSRDLQAQGVHLVSIIDPGVKQETGYSVYEEGAEHGYFAQTPEDEIYQNVVWPGESVFPDFTSSAVRHWWGDKLTFLTDQGISGIWNDMNEPASFRGPLPDDVVFPGEDTPRQHREVHNVYGHLMARATYEGLKKHTSRRPFVITRACYSGSQKYSTAWTGDNQSIWSHLKMSVPQLLNLGMSGMPFVGTDIGGFGSNTTAELLCRWVQASCFAPLFRNHCAKFSRCQEPWQFDAQTLDIYRTYVRLRYKFLPYLYDLFYEESQTGLPILRPLVMHYQNDAHVRECNDEYLVGDCILVAPVTDQGARARAVYLPAGDWIDYWSHERISGGRYILREAPLALCPMYIKAGSILPTWPQQNHIPDGGADRLILECYAPTASSVYLHYQDNGTDFSYEKGAYNRYRFRLLQDGSLETTLLHDGYTPHYAEISVVQRI